jgi:hypothetical protein
LIISRTGSLDAPLTVRFSVSGTASNGIDYSTIGSMAVIPAGAASTTITVTPLDDSLVEGDQTVVITLAADASYIVGSTASAVVLIVDDDITADNLLSDPGFENNGQGWQKTTNGGRSIVSSPTHSGSAAQQMIVSNQFTREVIQDVDIIGGLTYDAAGWVRTTNVNGEGSSIALLWLDAAGNVIHRDLVGRLTGTNDWTLLAGRFTAPANAVRVRFQLFTDIDPDNSGTAWFDDLAFSLAP